MSFGAFISLAIALALNGVVVMGMVREHKTHDQRNDKTELRNRRRKSLSALP